MGFFTRERAEKVVEYAHYPEPWPINSSSTLQFWWRFWLGRPMDNKRWTNATFWRPASRGEASWWLRLAGWQRLSIRLAVPALLMLLLAAGALHLLGAHRLLLQLLLSVLVFFSPVLLLLDLHMIREHGLRSPVFLREQRGELTEQERAEISSEVEILEREQEMVWRLQVLQLREGRREWERTVVEPLAKALAERTDNIFRAGDTDWISVPRDYLEPGGGSVEILLPANFGGDPAAIKGLERVIRNKLGAMDMMFDWQLRGNAPRVIGFNPPVPPKVAPFSAYREMLEQSREFSPFLGVVASGELLSAEMVSDSPHIALSAGSGAGKSMMSKAIIMQALRWGWGVVILDWKAESHSWAKGLRGVTYVTTEEGIHDMGVRLGQEVDIRKESGLAGRASVLVVCEEWNHTAALLSDYWSVLRSTADPEEKKTMPIRSPGLRGYAAVDFAGRQFGMFNLLIAQRMSNRVFNGNTDRRENYMIRLLARYSAQTWRMLIPEIKPIKKPKELGRWVVWAQDEITVIQGILISDEEAREYAAGGAENPPTPFSSGWEVGTVVDETAQVTSDGTQAPTLEDQSRHDGTGRHAIESRPVRLMSLTSIAENHMVDLGFTRGALENAARPDRQNAENPFPKVKGGDQFSGYLYDLEEVREWGRKKRAAQAARKAQKA